ncbi:hypothetical protein HMI54_001887 [Coelomomyces lativittatus]|nr:hypothetical protein HMI56_001496 [Coelomomyces lativittatus]KAJ1518235.1 hypothetical protein HMI54_001887 [Coelomomyces lativittatus]
MHKAFVLFCRRLKKFLQLTDGRDKSIKISQYTLQLLLLYYLTQPTTARRPTLAMKSLSMTRKLLRLGDSVSSFLDIYESPSTWIHWINVFNDVIDDLICLSKLNLLPDSFATFLDPWSSRCWCISVIYDFHHAKTNLTKYKLACDFLFVMNDLVPNKHTKHIQAWTGLAAGCLSTYALWKKTQLTVSN